MQNGISIFSILNAIAYDFVEHIQLYIQVL